MNYFDLTFKKKERNWKQNKYMYFYYAGRATIYLAMQFYVI